MFKLSITLIRKCSIEDNDLPGRLSKVLCSCGVNHQTYVLPGTSSTYRHVSRVVFYKTLCGDGEKYLEVSHTAHSHRRLSTEIPLSVTKFYEDSRVWCLLEPSQACQPFEMYSRVNRSRSGYERGG